MYYYTFLSTNVNVNEYIYIYIYMHCNSTSVSLNKDTKSDPTYIGYNILCFMQYLVKPKHNYLVNYCK